MAACGGLTATAAGATETQIEIRIGTAGVATPRPIPLVAPLVRSAATAAIRRGRRPLGRPLGNGGRGREIKAAPTEESEIEGTMPPTAQRHQRRLF